MQARVLTGKLTKMLFYKVVSFNENVFICELRSNNQPVLSALHGIIFYLFLGKKSVKPENNAWSLISSFTRHALYIG